MTLTMHAITVPVIVRMLKNERTWLDKALAFAELKKFDPSVLLQARLAPDQFAFTRQVQSSSDNAKGMCSRLAVVDNPRFEDTESTIAELQARLDKTIAFIEGIPAEKFAGAEDREIAFPSGRGERRFKDGVEYIQKYGMPNFFFHVTHAYAILRHNGVELGKTDYLFGGGT